MKKSLSMILALAMIMSLFAGLTVTASADYSGTGTFTRTTGTLESGYYVFTYATKTTMFPMSNDTSGNNWILPGADFGITETVENPDASVVWYYDAGTGTINSAGDPTLFVSWPTTGNSAKPTTTATPLTIEDTGDGVYEITVTATPARMLRYNSQSSGWRFYTSNTGSADFTIFKLDDGGETPSHEHDWSAWTSNGDSTHSRTCQAADCPIGTQTEACSFEDRVTTEPTCVDEGEMLHTCTVCGYSRAEAIPATGQHTDEDGDGVCDVCGEAMPEVVVYTLGMELHEGDEVVIRTCAVSESEGGYVVLSTTASGNKLTGVQANISIEEEQLVIVDNATAVLTVEYADAQNFNLKTPDGRYLTTGATGNSLSFADTASDYSLWYLETADTGSKAVYIRSTNAAYNGNKNQALEYYNSLFTTFGIKTNSAYQFQLYIHANPDAHIHSWDEGVVTTEPTCTAKGVMTYSCSGCDETYTEEIPMIAHADGDEDGLCDACQGKIFSQAETLNDGDSLILVTGAFGVAMTGAASGSYMAAAEVNAQAGVTVPAAEDNVWTVKTADEGFYLVNNAGQYLCVNTSNKLALGGEDSDNILWTIGEPVEGLTATGAYLFNPGSGRYLEYGKNYNNYQTYGAPTADYETCYAFTFYTVPAEPEPLDDGYYLLIAHGEDDWVIRSVDPANKFEPNGNAQDEWLLSTTLAVEDQIKVVRIENNAITGWWPNGEHTQYHVDEAHSGNVTIYFKTDYVNDWSAFGGYFYIGSLLKPDLYADVYGCSVSLKGNIALNFYVIPGEELLADENAYVLLGETRHLFSEAATRTAGEDTLYLFQVSLHVKQMNDAVVLRVYDGEDNVVALYRHSNSEDLTETGYSYSVQDYIAKVRETSTDEKLLALVNAMSDYGSLAQAQFNYHADSRVPVTGDLDSVTAESVADFQAKITKGKVAGVTYYGTSLLLQSETVMRIYFTLDEGAVIDDFTFKVGSKVTEPVESDGMWYVDVKNIAAKDLDRFYTVTVSAEAGRVVTVKACALSYTYNVLSAEETPAATLVDLVKGLYLYSEAANAYFG